MNFQEADKLLQGRCSQSRKLENNTYLKRHESYGERTIALRLHSTDILVLHPNGRIEVSIGRWNTPTTRNRINKYLRKPWHVYSEHGCAILSNRRWSSADSPSTEYSERLLDNSATILPDGRVSGGKNVERWRAEIRQQDNARRRQNSRLRYWIQAARGIYRDSSSCTGRSFRCGCHPRPFRRAREVWTEPGQCSICGCKFVRKVYAGALTVAGILAEENTSVRTAMISCYGLERFVLEAGASVVDAQAGYELVELKLDDWRSMRALKMVCPSTHVVYISPVEPRLSTVPETLDWMFQTENYLEQVAQQT